MCDAWLTLSCTRGFARGRRGSTAGGTQLTLLVDYLPAAATNASFSVLVAGIPCVVNHIADDRVVCRTGSYGRTSQERPGEGVVQLTIAGVGAAVTTADCVFEYVDMWSRQYTWGGIGSTIPGVGAQQLDSVWIQRGQKILLDLDVRIYMLIVEGSLEFDRKDIFLDVNYIFVFNGRFTIGTETEPFLHRATITLYGSPVSQEIPIYGSKVLACRFCTLDLHGRPVLEGRTHTKLARTALQGSTELWLMEPVDWCVETTDTCQIALSSTRRDGSPWNMEHISIERVTHGGMRLEIAAPLAFDHLGETRYLSDGYSVDFRANVALLSSNVLIQGEPTFSQLDQHGGHIMLHSRRHRSIADQSKGESLTARIENVELRFMGQFGRLGRYPVHFHMIGAVRNSYLRKNRIHHTYHRCISIHGVHHLRVLDNVCYLNKAHSIFVEDAVERKNVIQGNIVIGTRPCFSCLNSDMTPASYWLVNPDNYVERNIAAGSTHYGFWWFIEAHVVGKSAMEPGSNAVCPPSLPILRFADNEAHNNGVDGMRFGADGVMYRPSARLCGRAGSGNPFVTAEFLRGFSWRNVENGFFIGNVAACHFVDFVGADNTWRNFEFPGVMPFRRDTVFDGGWGAVALIRPLVIAHDLPCPACDRRTDLLTYGAHGDGGWGAGLDCFPQQFRIGIATPVKSGLYVTGATFINYDRPSVAAVTGATKVCEGCPYGVIPANTAETRFRNTRWIESFYRVRWRFDNEALFRDLDGTFTGRDFCAQPRPRAQCTVLKNAIVTDARATPECFSDVRYGWGVCKGDVQFVAVDNAVAHDGSMPEWPCGMAYQMRRNATRGIYMDQDAPDMAHLRDLWLAEGFHWYPYGRHTWAFIHMDISSDRLSATLPANDKLQDASFWASWSSARGEWINRRTIRMTWTFEDQLEEGSPFSSGFLRRTLIGDLSEDGGTLVWRNGSDLAVSSHQLLTQIPWYRCEVHPQRCARSGARYTPAEYVEHPCVGQGGIAVGVYLLPYQRYGVWSSSGQYGEYHLGAYSVTLRSEGVVLPDAWLEFESQPERAHVYGNSPSEGGIGGTRLQAPWTIAVRHNGGGRSIFAPPRVMLNGRRTLPRPAHSAVEHLGPLYRRLQEAWDTPLPGGLGWNIDHEA